MPAWFLPALMTFLCWGLWAFLPKLTTRYLDPRSAIVYEALGGLVLVALVWGSGAGRLGGEPRGVALALITGSLGVGGALAYLYALQKGPVALIATVTALYPIFAIVLAALILQEPVSLRQGIGIALGLLAMVLVSR
ncbi:EamA family transporter [Candidatus Methylocalor cossyra]